MMKSKYIWIWLIIAILAALYPLFLGKFYGIGDMVDVYIPIEKFYRTEILAGNLAAWQPDVAWGFPIIASAQIGFFYPLLFISTLLPLWLGLPGVLTLHLIAAGIGMYLLLRRQSVSQWGAVLGAASFVLSGFIWQHFTHLNVILILSWLPWQLLVAYWAARRHEIRQILVLGLALGIPFLAGQMQLPAWSALVTTSYFIYLANPIKGRIVNWNILGMILLAAVVALGISAVQLLPTYELMQYSSRGTQGSFDITQANQHSWPIYHAPTLLFPRFFGNDNTYWGKGLEIEYGFFIGTLPLLLAVFAVTKKFKQRGYWLGLALITWLLALGDMSPVRLLGIEPSMWVFSAPARWLLYTTLAGSVLAAHGFDLIASYQLAFKKLVWRVLIVLGVIITGFNVLIWSVAPKHAAQALWYWIIKYFPQVIGVRPETYYIEKIMQIVYSARDYSVSLASFYTWLPLIILVTIILVFKRHNFKQILVVITLAELVIVAATTSPTVAWSELLTPPESVQELPNNVRAKQVRLLTLSTQENTGLLLNNPDTRADENDRKLLRESLVSLIHSQFGIAGVAWPASLDLQKSNEALSTMRSRTDGVWQLNFDAIKKGNVGVIMSTDELATNPELIGQQLSSGVWLYEVEARPRAELRSKGEFTPVIYEQLSASKIRLNIESDAGGELVVRDTWYPGWRATIGNSETEINVVEKIFRSVDVPSGEHVVEMQYRPKMIYLGGAVSILTIILVGGYLLRQKYSSTSRGGRT